MFSDLALARRIELAEAAVAAEFMTVLSRVLPAAGAEAEMIGAACATCLGGSEPGGRVFALGMAGAVSAEDLDRVDQFCRSRAAPADIEVCPLADVSLLHLLSERGYRLIRFQNTLVRPLDSASPVPALASGIEVRRAAAIEAPVWARLVLRGMTGSEEVPEPLIEINAARSHLPTGCLFLAMVADQPVGGGALLAHEGLGIFSMDGTLPQFRNRGVQAALIRARLAAAITAGCDLGLAHTSPGSTSQRSYERQGFRVAYSRATLVRSLSPSGVHKCHAKEET